MMKQNNNNLYYSPQWDVFGISVQKGEYVFLVTSELEEQSNIYRVLTNNWILIGELG